MADLLRATGIAPVRLRIEVTENAVMADAERALAILRRLRALGVQLSIDDFGTGHSSLARLKAMPVHELKIDKSFVLHMHEDDRDAAIVEAAVTLAQRLDVTVVAEGVETDAAWDQLHAIGRDHAQGLPAQPPALGRRARDLGRRTATPEREPSRHPPRRGRARGTARPVTPKA